jgi:hypothetical protein
MLPMNLFSAYRVSPNGWVAAFLVDDSCGDAGVAVDKYIESGEIAVSERH